MQLSIGEVAARTGISIYTLRFYEREGLMISAVRRTSGGRRVYQQADVDWLFVCTRLRASGMSLANLRSFAELVREGPGNEQQRLALLRAHQETVQRRLDELRGCLELITWKVGVYEEHLRQGTARGVWDPITAGPGTTAADADLGRG